MQRDAEKALWETFASSAPLRLSRLATNRISRVGSMDYLGAFGLPTMPVKVKFSAKTSSGTAVERVSPRVFQVQSVQVISDAANPSMIAVTIPTEVRFSVVNNGAIGVFNMAVSSTLGNVSGISPSVFSLAGGGSTQVVATVSIPDGTATGTRFSYTAIVTLQTDSSVNNSASVSATVSGASGPQIEILPTPPLTTTNLNRQTGLYEHRIVVTNKAGASASAFLVQVSNLPPSVILYNASGTNAAEIPFLLYNNPLPVGSSVNLKLEYYSYFRTNVPNPRLSVEVASPVVIVPDTGTPLAVHQVKRFNTGAVLVEFDATPGRAYRIQYSSDMATWSQASPRINAVSNRVQWIDDGPPKIAHRESALASTGYWNSHDSLTINS